MSDEKRSRRCENCRFAEAVPSVLTFVSYNNTGWVSAGGVRRS